VELAQVGCAGGVGDWIETANGNPLVKLAKDAGVATHADPEEAEELFIDTVAGRRLSASADRPLQSNRIND
jgi:hypothetical protein